ncbi:MAG: ubiquinone/menaquinone biosynthesis methyltransferase [Coriobacteriia bacterium]|nr:ubiquinone/menaquinone biosynthesis methyltransferase [Coriobacteriia bacterium]MCL2537572.1 ubiquinone/menaquinone biosynthesis methyltransferase [Coriobacteriia bacterium]
MIFTAASNSDAHEHPVTAHDASPEEKTARAYEIFQTISTDYDKVNDAISFGQHRAWKRNMIKRIVASKPSDILDIASGTGDIAIWLGQELPDARIVASDFAPNMLEVAKKRITEAGLTNVSTRVQDATALDYPDNSFDVCCVSFGMRNMPDYALVTREMTRVLRPGGSFYCLDSSYPTNPIIKPFFKLYFKFVMPKIGGMISKAPAEYQWLNDSTEVFLSKTELADLLKSEGLQDVGYKSFMFGGSALHFGTKPI